ncbi:MAG: hypothetical protein RL664_1006 [Bacteroidota bacterium]|jgi:hypothetical protein
MYNYFLGEVVMVLPIFVFMEKKILLSLFLFFGTIGLSFAQSNIISRHNSDESWINFLQNNMVSVTLAPEKALASPSLITSADVALDSAVPTTQMLFGILNSTPALQPDANETKTYRWGNTDYVITVFSVKRLETLYKRKTINNKAK